MDNLEDEDLQYDLIERKKLVSESMKKIDIINTPEPKRLIQLEKYDNTNTELLMQKIKSQKNTKKLLFQGLDILSKKELLEFNIKKEFSNKDSFFYLITYMQKVNIIDEVNNINLEPKTDDNQEKKEPEIIIDCSNKNILIVQQTSKQEKENEYNNNYENNKYEDDKKYEDFLSKKNHKISDYFKLNEKIDLYNLRQKLEKYDTILTLSYTYKNNIPTFESELFFYIQLKNIINTFIELNDEKFKKK